MKRAFWLSCCLVSFALPLASPGRANVVANCSSFSLFTSYATLQNWPYDAVRLQIPWNPNCGGFSSICSPLPAFVGANVRQSGSDVLIDIFGSETALPPNVLNVAPFASPQQVFIDVGPLSLGTHFVRATVYGVTDGVVSDLCNGQLGLTTLTIEQASMPAARQTAVEFYNQSRDHYFITSDPAEVAKLDAGTQPDWARTGKSFAVFAAGKSGGVGVPVCRFYGSPSAGLDSHFYTSNASECASLPRSFGGAWQLETANAFEVRAMNTQAQCVAGFVPIYRLWNRRADSNHRFTTDIPVVEQMRKKGWIVESAVGEGPSMCSPP